MAFARHGLRPEALALEKRGWERCLEAVKALAAQARRSSEVWRDRRLRDSMEEPPEFGASGI